MSPQSILTAAKLPLAISAHFDRLAAGIIAGHPDPGGLLDRTRVAYEETMAKAHAGDEATLTGWIEAGVRAEHVRLAINTLTEARAAVAGAGVAA